LRRVYIDEAGDRGGADRSSRYFVVSALILDDASDAIARQELLCLKQVLRRKPSDTLHFRKLTHSQKVKACQEVANFSVQRFTSVVMCKKVLSTPLPDGGLAHISQPDPMYLWAIRLLLERISWFIRDSGGGTSTVTFAHLKRFKAAKLHDYREALCHSSTSIHWPSFEDHLFRLNTPNSVEMLQVADICASALFKAVEPDQYGNTEPRYLTELRPIIYRDPRGRVTSYGLKVFPDVEGEPGGSLFHLRRF
jgi:Protein of unknown function (DUF3800)